MNIILFIIILAILVFVHELGHFLVAKRAGIRVDEFGLGFPPRLYGRKYGETLYSINWVPFGGFVKIFGEDHGDVGEKSANAMLADDLRGFSKKSKWTQASVLVAGVTMNILFAWILISSGFAAGMPTPVDAIKGAPVADAKLTVTGVLPGSPASKAGLKSGDQIVSLTSSHKELLSPERIVAQDFIAESDGPVEIYVKRGEADVKISVTPTTGIVENRQAIGIAMDMVGTLKLPIHKAFWYGAQTTYHLTLAVVGGLWDFIYEAFAGRASLSQVTGPIGIIGLVGDTSALGLVYLVSFTAFISINLAVINLIPFPALDGGRLLFVLIEAIKGSPIRPKILKNINAVGFALLLLLMAVVTYQDVVRMF